MIVRKLTSSDDLYRASTVANLKLVFAPLIVLLSILVDLYIIYSRHHPQRGTALLLAASELLQDEPATTIHKT